MFLNKSLVADNGATLDHHFIVEMKMLHGQDKLHLLIHSWPNEASRLAGNAELARWSEDVDLAELSFGAGGLKAALFTALMNRVRWAGAAAFESPAPTLAGAKAMQWARIKAERTKREFGTLVWDGSTFDIDMLSSSRIRGAALDALKAISNATAYSETWTLTDNSERTLSALEVVALNAALRQHVSALHATSRFLRAQIEGATTIEDVQAVVWP